MFDRYASLGNNCEVAFQIRRVLGKDSSGFFSWNVTPLNSLIALLENDFSGILKLENLKNEPSKGLLYDSFYDFYVHSSYLKDNLVEEDNLIESLEDLRSKFNHLAAKFREYCEDGFSTVYFMKTEDNTDIELNCEKVSSLLRKFHRNKTYKLVVVRPVDKKDDNVDTIYVAYRYLKRAAPWADATDGHVQSWDRIFKEFPSKGGLRLAGY